MVRVISVEPLDDFILRVSFDDGSVRVVNIQPWLRGPAFEAVRSDERFFRLVRVVRQGTGIEWPNGADLDPLVLHGDYPPAWINETDGR